MVLTTLVLFSLASACSKSSSPTTNCTVLSVCCAAPGFPEAERATCASTVSSGDDTSCQSVLSALSSLGYCHAGSGGSSGGAGGNGGGSGGAGGNGGASASTSSQTSTSGSGVGSTTSGGAGGPVIQSLSANPNPLTPTGTTVSAVVTDTSGLSDLSGGTLTDKVYGTNYGAFVTPGGQGTFIFSLTWSELYQAHAINFAAGSSESRVVTANFFDAQSRTASQDVTLTLQCAAATDGPCSAGCTNLTTDGMNCGACGTVCTTASVCQQENACACRAAHCSDIVFAARAGGGASCNAICQKLGGTCAPNTCNTLAMGAEGQTNNAIPCSDTTDAPYACCCQH